MPHRSRHSRGRDNHTSLVAAGDWFNATKPHPRNRNKPLAYQTQCHLQQSQNKERERVNPAKRGVHLERASCTSCLRRVHCGKDGLHRRVRIKTSILRVRSVDLHWIYTLSEMILKRTRNDLTMPVEVHKWSPRQRRLLCKPKKKMKRSSNTMVFNIST